MGSLGVRLTKADAERLVTSIDTDAIFETVDRALRSLLRADDASPHQTILLMASRVGGWSSDRLAALQSGDDTAFAVLATELAELRTLVGPTDTTADPTGRRRSLDEGH